MVFSATTHLQKKPLARAIQQLERRISRDKDWVTERGGFEPRDPFGFDELNSARVWCTIRPDKKASALEEFVRLGFGSASSLSGSLPSLGCCAEFGDVARQRKVWSSNLSLLGGKSVNSIYLSGIARDDVRDGVAGGFVFGAVSHVRDR